MERSQKSAMESVIAKINAQTPDVQKERSVYGIQKNA